MPIALPTIIAIVASGVLVIGWLRWKRAVRADYIRKYALPKGLYDKLRMKRPELALKDCQLVGHALRQFFLTYLNGDFKQVSMPSQVVDDLWHEFILYTRHYDTFCRRAFGRFLHHSPAVVLGSGRERNIGLRRCWWFACREENINPREPTRLPLLFAIDAKLKIAGGFVYAANCDLTGRGNKDGTVHCGSDFGSEHVDGSTEGFGDLADGVDFDVSGDGCSGGCGGD